METITLGDKRIRIKTSVLEEKATACNILCYYVDELKKGFFPLVDQVKENQEKNKIGSKRDKNGKRGETGKSLKQLQLKEKEKTKKTKKEWPKTHTRIKTYASLKIEEKTRA